MSFSSGFENDIFISYCHDDNDAPRQEPGWVDYFHEDLESSMVRRLGKNRIVIWRDKKLNNNTVFNKKLQEQIGKSALFMVLMSPNYLRSHYCRQEREWFCKEAKKSRYGLSVAHESRIINVLLKNVHHTLWPEQLKGVGGFSMHDEKEESGKLGEALDRRETPYSKQLRLIVDAIEKTLRLFSLDNIRGGNGIGITDAQAEWLLAEQQRQDKVGLERLEIETETFPEPRRGGRLAELEAMNPEMEGLRAEKTELLKKLTVLRYRLTRTEKSLAEEARRWGEKERQLNDRVLILEQQLQYERHMAQLEKQKDEERFKTERAQILLERDGLLEKLREVRGNLIQLDGQGEQNPPTKPGVSGLQRSLQELNASMAAAPEEKREEKEPSGARSRGKKRAVIIKSV